MSLFGCYSEADMMEVIDERDAARRAVQVLAAALRKTAPLLSPSEREWVEGALLTAAMEGEL